MIYKKFLLVISFFVFNNCRGYESNSIIANIPLPMPPGNHALSIRETVTGFTVPLSLAITPNGDFVYVIDVGNNSANVIDTATNTLLNTPALNNIFNVPQSIAITPDGDFAYVASAGAGSVVVIDTNPASPDYNMVTDTITPFYYPEALAITPDGNYVYVANDATSTINIISIASNMITTTIAGFAVPVFIAITPNGDYAYVANLFDGVSVVDTNPTSPTYNTIIPTPALDSGFLFPQSVTITPNGQYTYVTNLFTGVVVIDNASNTIIPTPGLTSRFNRPVSIAFTPDGFYGYVSNAGNNTVSVIYTPSNTIIDTITGFDNPQTIAITPDGQYAYVANAGNNTVSVIFIGLHGPIDSNGCKRKNIFLTQIDNYDHLTWVPPPEGNAPVSYQIYRDAGLTQLVATVPSEILQYDDHHRNPNINYTYYIVSLDALGNISYSTPITVTQTCKKNNLFFSEVC